MNVTTRGSWDDFRLAPWVGAMDCEAKVGLVHCVIQTLPGFFQEKWLQLL